MDAVLEALAEGATVITANNRLARSLALAFNRRQRAAGSLAWRTPAILPWRAWIESLWEASLAEGGQAGQRALLSDFQCRMLWREIAKASGGGQLANASAPMADLAAGAGRLALDWRLGPADLAAAADSDDTRSFAEWADSYHERCRSEGLADDAMIVPLLVDDIRSGSIASPARVHLVGFDDWTPLQRDLLRAIAAQGCIVAEEPAPRVERGERLRVACHDGLAELDAAARWARQQLQDDPARSVAIVIPNLASRIAEVRRAVLDVIAPDWRLAPGHELPVNFSFAGPLAGHGIVHAALLALRGLSGSLDFKDVGQLLRTPYLAGSSAEAGLRASLDLALRERIGMSLGLAEFATRAERMAPILGARLRGLQRVAADAPRRQATSGWADTFRAALQALGWPGDRPLATDEYQAGMACQGLWDSLRACERMAGRLPLEAALGLLERLARDQPFQPAGHPEGLQVLGTLEAVGQRFDALWICGLTSDAWPAAGRPNPLLPLALQRELRMPDSSPPVSRERAERMLRWLESSAPLVIASWPEFDGEEPLTASPLIAPLVAASVESLPRWTGRRKIEALAAARSTRLLEVDPPPPVATGARLRGGSALLERQAKCPARAFLEFRLGARELSVPSLGIDASTRGSVTHAVLEAFYKRVRTHADLCRLPAGEESALLAELIDAALADRVPLADPVVAQLAQLERVRLHGLLTAFLGGERERSGFVVRWIEEMPAAEEAAPAPLRGLRISLRPDRVDELPDGKHLVIDYKTGRNIPGMKELWGPRPRSPQLPLYATLLDADGIAFIQINVTGVRWAGIGAGSWQLKGVVEPEKATKGQAPDWGSLRASWWSALARLAEEILAGSFNVDRWRREDAGGQWAMATRVHELPDDDVETAE